MTDCASRKLKIEKMIATSLKCYHEPVNLLWKSHTVDKLNPSNLNVLSKDESSVNQRQALENKTLLSHNKSGRSRSQVKVRDISIIQS